MLTEEGELFLPERTHMWFVVLLLLCWGFCCCSCFGFIFFLITVGSGYMDLVLTHTEHGSRDVVPQVAPVPSLHYRLLRGAVQLLGYITAGNSSSVRHKLAFSALIHGMICRVQLAPCTGELPAASSLLVFCVADNPSKIKGWFWLHSSGNDELPSRPHARPRAASQPCTCFSLAVLGSQLDTQHQVLAADRPHLLSFHSKRFRRSVLFTLFPPTCLQVLGSCGSCNLLLVFWV